MAFKIVSCTNKTYRVRLVKSNTIISTAPIVFVCVLKKNKHPPTRGPNRENATLTHTTGAQRRERKVINKHWEKRYSAPAGLILFVVDYDGSCKSFAKRPFSPRFLKRKSRVHSTQDSNTFCLYICIYVYIINLKV